MRYSDIQTTRREFFNTTASGMGLAGLGSMLSNDGLLSAQSAQAAAAQDPLAARDPHFNPKAKACIFIFMAGAPSHVDLFDPKPKLNELHGKPLPESLLKNVRFAFLKKETATLMGSNRTFRPHGQSGTEFSDLLPNVGALADDLCVIRSLHSSQFNHHPGQLLMQCGAPRFGLPTLGSWLTYGLGSETRNLPGYVVLTAGRGSSGGATLWQSGFLPSLYAGVLFRNQGEPVLNLKNPAGLPPELQRRGLDVLQNVNRSRFQEIRDPEISSRIASYELAFRMQSAAPELTDLSGETRQTLDMYGIDRPEPEVGDLIGASATGGTYKSFASNCLLARRMVERGVRFVNIVHASWDHHENLDRQISYNAKMVDQPIAALIQDLKQRGLLDQTMVVWGAEFGRTPLGQNDRADITGRDHHPYAFSMFLSGGGIRGGQAYGESDEVGWGIAKNPVHANDLHATMLHCFGLDHLRLTHRFQGRDFRLTDVGGKVIKELLA